MMSSLLNDCKNPLPAADGSTTPEEFLDSTPAPRRTISMAASGGALASQQLRCCKRDRALEQAQAALEDFEEIHETALHSSSVDPALITALKALTDARDRAEHEVEVAHRMLARLAPVVPPTTSAVATPVVVVAPREPQVVRYAEYPNKAPYEAFLVTVEDVSTWMLTAETYFNTSQPSPRGHTRVLMLNRAMGTPELVQMYSAWLQGHPQATWEDARAFLLTKVPWKDIPVIEITALIDFPPMSPNAPTTAMTVANFTNSFIAFCGKKAFDTSLDLNTGAFPDRKNADGGLNTGFVLFDRLVARLFISKLSLVAREAYEAFRAHESATQRSAGTGYLHETLKTVIASVERIHFPKGIKQVPALVSDSGGGRILERATGRPWPKKTAEGKEADKCFNCGSTAHYSRACPKFAQQGVTNRQFNVLQVAGNKRVALSQGLAHQKAGIKLTHIGQPHKAEAEANIEATEVEVEEAQAAYDTLLARYAKDNGH